MDEKLICKICQREFKNYTAISSHVKKIHNILPKDYYDIYYKKNNEGICECGKETKFAGMNFGYTKYCCKKCLKSSFEYKEKISKTMKNIWDNDIEFRKLTTERNGERYKDPEYIKNVHIPILKRGWNKDGRREKQASYTKNLWKDNEYKERVSKKIKDGFTEDGRKRISEKSKERWKNVEYKNNISKKMKYYNNLPEIKKQISSRSKKSWDNPEAKKQASLRAKEMWENQETRKKILESQSNVKQQMIENNKLTWSNSEVRNRASESHKDNWKKRCLLKKEEFIKKTIMHQNKPEVKRQKQLRTKAQWKNPEYRKMMLGVLRKCKQARPSKPQIELYNLIKIIFINAQLEYPIFGYFVDIAIPDKKIAIEYDGSYWHKDKDSDNKRQKIIENKGWNVIRYVDYIPTFHELKEMFSKNFGFDYCMEF